MHASSRPDAEASQTCFSVCVAGAPHPVGLSTVELGLVDCVECLCTPNERPSKIRCGNQPGPCSVGRLRDMAKGKIGTILVRLVSSAGTGYTYVKVRTRPPSTHR